MHTVWKSRWRVREVFAKFWEGGYIGVVKILGGGYNFYPPSPPPLCASMWWFQLVSNFKTFKYKLKHFHFKDSDVDDSNPIASSLISFRNSVSCPENFWRGSSLTNIFKAHYFLYLLFSLFNGYYASNKILFIIGTK